ncbi:MAG: hypothetical protein AAF677_12375 [Pseudomonadota bacterium]
MHFRPFRTALALALVIALPGCMGAEEEKPTAAARNAVPSDFTAEVWPGPYDLLPLTRAEAAEMERTRADLAPRLRALRGTGKMRDDEIDAMLQALNIIGERELPSVITYDQLDYIDAAVRRAEDRDLSAEARRRLLAGIYHRTRSASERSADYFADLWNLSRRLGALVGKEGCAGERRIVLDLEKGPRPGTLVARASFSGTLVAPGRGNQAYEITCLVIPAYAVGAGVPDMVGATLAREGYGTLSLEIEVGDGRSNASFDMFPAGANPPTRVTRGSPRRWGSMAGRYDIRRGRRTQMAFGVTSDSHVFNFGAVGNWFSPKGSTNDYRVSVTLELQSALWRLPPSLRPVPSASGGGIRG